MGVGWMVGLVLLALAAAGCLGGWMGWRQHKSEMGIIEAEKAYVLAQLARMRWIETKRNS